MEASPGEITRLLAGAQKGDADAVQKLIRLVYGEMRRIAAHYMRLERPDHTLQATALVHEAYLKMVGKPNFNWDNRAHFFAVAARQMRTILIDYARGRGRDKRGGGQSKVPLDEGLVFSPEKSSELIALDEALQRLERLDPRQSRIVELRFFGDLSVAETAVVLGISDRTVKREWNVARLWLHREIARAA